MSGIQQGAKALISIGGKKQRAKDDFEQVTMPHYDRIYTAAMYFLRDGSKAEDLVQETYLRACRFFDQFERGTNCRAWLLSILRNTFINRYRRQKQEPDMVQWDNVDQSYDSMIVESERACGGNPEALFFNRILDGEIEDALKTLPEEFRMAVVLVDIQELTYDEAAHVMDCPVGTVRSRLSRARRLLQTALYEYAREHNLLEKS